MSTEIHDAAAQAAWWWAEQVGCPTFRNTCERDSEEDQRNGAFAGILAMMAASHHEVTDEQAASFVIHLSEALSARLDNVRYAVTVGVDYGPDKVLHDAADAAGISPRRFPWKTHMSIQKDHVTASLGYGAPRRLVWASDEWLANRPACDSQKWDESNDTAGYHGEPFACHMPKYHDGPCRFTEPISLCRDCGADETWPSHEPSDYKHHPFNPMAPGERWAPAAEVSK